MCHVTCFDDHVIADIHDCTCTRPMPCVLGEKMMSALYFSFCYGSKRYLDSEAIFFISYKMQDEAVLRCKSRELFKKYCDYLFGLF